MINRSFYYFLILFAAVFVFAKPTLAVSNSPTNVFKRVIIFGDSYSDNGNVFRETREIIPNPARYYQGRFSNGPSWGEYFAEFYQIDPTDTNHFIDMAFGGAKIIHPVNEVIHGKPAKHYIVPNLSQQIDLYLKQHNRFENNDLVVVFMGTNDFLPLFHARAKVFFERRADQESLQVKRLMEHGAKHLIVFNVRNLSYIPFIQFLSEKKYFPLNYIDNYYRRYLLRSIQSFNARLEENLKNKPEIFIYDIFNFDTAIFSKIKGDGFNYSFENHSLTLKFGAEPCYKNYKNNYQDIVGSVCQNPTEYFFYDRIHTTTMLNYLLAKDVYRQYSNK